MWYLLLYSKKPAESLWPHHGKPHSVSSVPVHSDSSRLVFGLVWECLLLTMELCCLQRISSRISRQYSHCCEFSYT